MYLAVLWCVEDVHCAGFDAIGLGPSVQSKAALSAPPISAWKTAIVPEKFKQKSAPTQEASHTQTHLDQTGSNMFIPGHPDKA